MRTAHEEHMYDMVCKKARAFMLRNARPLDWARWQYHFEQGDRLAVMDALAAYQNADGGFGHALEPDAWNPQSTPIQTWAVTEILWEIGWKDAGHPMVEGLLRYLASGQDFNGHTWANTCASNNDHPHAPWWHSDSTSTCHLAYNPTACLAGFLLRFAQDGSAAHQLGQRIAREAYDAYLAQHPLPDMHTASCYIRLYQYAKEAGCQDVFDVSALEDMLRQQVTHSITHNIAQWETGYICRPSQFFNQRSIFYQDNADIAEYECQFIARTQLPDGSWPIPWRWADYPEQWAISKNWWKGIVAVNNLLYLKGMSAVAIPL